VTDVPMLFSAPMVRALLAGTKTQTRRLRGVPTIEPSTISGESFFNIKSHGGGMIGVPANMVAREAADYLPTQSGDRIWVREAWSGEHIYRNTRPSEREDFTTADGPHFRADIWYWADGNPSHGDYERPRPSLHLPRYGSRLTLIVTEARVQRLQDISDEDAQAEGVDEATCYRHLKSPHFNIDETINPPLSGPHWRLGYERLWDKINGKTAPWASNPWVAAYTFAVHRCNIDEAPK
jgi:hypothetical protein